MALRMTPISRNLQTRVKFFGLEIEDLLVLGVLCVFAMLGGQFAFPDRYLFYIPMNWALLLLILFFGVPGLMVFKYGKPRGYVSDLMNWYSRPHAYSAAEPDHQLNCPYIDEEEA